VLAFFFSSRRRHTRFSRDWSSDVCSSDLVLDIVDHFVNQYGILLVAVVSTLAVAWGARALPTLSAHLNKHGSLRLGRWWHVLVRSEERRVGTGGWVRREPEPSKVGPAHRQ